MSEDEARKVAQAVAELPIEEQLLFMLLLWRITGDPKANTLMKLAPELRSRYNEMIRSGPSKYRDELYWP